MDVHFPFETDRLTLRPPTDRDLAQLISILGDPEVMKLALYERPLTAEEASQFIDQDFARDSRDVTHLGVLCRKEDDVVVGFAGLLPCKYFPTDFEFGFVLATEHHGKGYATEIGKKLLDIGFLSLGCERLLALCDPKNAASTKVLKKLGLSQIAQISTLDRGPRVVFQIIRADARG